MTDSQARHVTLLIPRLFDNRSRAAAKLSLAAPASPATLTTLLARADRRTLPVDGLEVRLFQLFGLHMNPEQDLPIAAVTRVADMGIVDNDWWIRADPVHLEPQRAGLVLDPLTDLTRDEADRLTAELNEVLRTDGWLLKAPHPLRWYLKPPGAPLLTTTPLRHVIGLDVHPHLPQGPDRKTWHTRLNELQILLHTSTINAAREARGAKTANSLWFWGGGRLPTAVASPWDEVVAGDAVSLGLARVLSIAHQPLPASAAVWLSFSDRPKRSLIVLDEVTALAGSQDLQALAENWLRPLTRAVHSGSVRSLTLISDSGPEFTYRRRHRWYFWRRPQAMESCESAA